MTTTTLRQSPPARPAPTRDRRSLSADWLGALLITAPLIFLGVNLILLARLVLSPGWFFTFIHHNYAFNTLIFPCWALICGGIGLWQARRGARRPRRLRLWAWSLLGMAAALLGARGWATHLEPNLLFVRQVAIEAPAAARPLRMLHITDIQSGRVGAIERRQVEKIRELAPDLILFTGDLLQPVPPATIAGELPVIDQLLRSLTPPLGFYAVVGDVDGAFYHPLREGLGGMQLLENREVEIEAHGLRLSIFGLGLAPSRGWTGARQSVMEWLDRTDPTAFKILIGHGPDYILQTMDLPIDLCLAGHTHGGQIRIPFFGPIITYSEVPRDWALGYREVGATRLNVSGGLGGEHLAGIPTIRVNCPPEMTLFEIGPVGPEPQGSSE